MVCALYITNSEAYLQTRNIKIAIFVIKSVHNLGSSIWYEKYAQIQISNKYSSSKVSKEFLQTTHTLP